MFNVEKYNNIKNFQLLWKIRSIKSEVMSWNGKVCENKHLLNELGLIDI